MKNVIFFIMFLVLIVSCDQQEYIEEETPVVNAQVCDFFQTNMHSEGNPLFTNTNEELSGWDPYVIYDEELQKYRMWYTLFKNRILGIAYAESDDGIVWSFRSNRESEHVIQPTEGSWDRDGIETVSVLKKNGIYHMWYLGYPGNKPANIAGRHKEIGYAYSDDGINWTKHRNSVLKGDSNEYEGPYLDTIVENGQRYIFKEGGVQEPSVVWNEKLNRFEMYYGGVTKRYFTIIENGNSFSKKSKYRPTLRALSSNGIDWVKDVANNPIIDPLDDIKESKTKVADQVGVYRDEKADKYLFFYFSDFSVFQAYSDDGVTIIRNPNNPVITKSVTENEVSYFGGPLLVNKDEDFKLFLMRTKPGAKKWGEGGMNIGLATADCQ